MKINIKELMEFLGCDEDFLRQLMKKFIDESGIGVIKLREGLDSRNWPLIRAVAHKMLSSTRIFSFIELSNLLEEIEIIAEEEKNTDQISDKVIKVEQIWKEVVLEMNLLLERPMN